MPFSSLLRPVILLLFAISTASCASGGQIATSAAEAGQVAYTLGAGDKVRLTVYGEEELTGEYTITPDGSIAVPLIGNVPASGQTPAALQAAIAAKLSPAYLLDPRVSIDVLTFRPFYILGEVNKPGQYPYVDQLTLAQAVATAGGFTYRANTKRVYVRRRDSAGETAYSLKGGRPVAVLPGDTIRVGERYF